MSVHEIIPGIWLGDLESSRNESFQRDMKIGVVVNCTKNERFLKNLGQVKIRVPVNDNLERNEIENLSRWAFEIVMRMDQE